MDVAALTTAPVDTDADTVAIGVFAGGHVSHDVDGGVLQALLDSGEAQTRLGHVTVAHAAGKRWILCGLGERDAFAPESARRAAAAVFARAGELSCSTLCWELAHGLDDARAGGLVEGTVLSSYRFARYLPATGEDAPVRPSRLLVCDHDDRTAAVRAAVALASAQNSAREIGDTAPNDATPEWLGERAKAIEGVEVTVEGRAALLARGMGAFAAVAQGSPLEPQLITIRHEPAGARGPLLALVGKAVTFDSGGLSIKSAASMPDMKYDLGGGAAVLGAMEAIAALALPVRVLAVVGATENVISGRAVRPGDVVTAMDGTTIEITNTDAEGRLVLSDCLLHARDLGAERLVDAATLTGGVVTALGDVYAGVFANDDGWAEQVRAAGEATGERLWRLPLDPGYAEQMKGTVAQLVNSAREKGKAHPITAAEFLHHFVGDVPWAHLDIAGVGWNLSGRRPYLGKGGSGFGVRLMAELARALG